MKTSSDLEKLVLDFNIDIGVNRLGGVVGCFEFFSDDSLIRSFDEMFDEYKEIWNEWHSNDDAMGIYLAGLKQDFEYKIGKKKANILFEYIILITVVSDCIDNCSDFVKWIVDADFDVQPYIFTKFVLLRCIQWSSARSSLSDYDDFNDYLSDVRRLARENPSLDPTPRYPRWVVVACIILSIVGFIFGFVRSC